MSNDPECQHALGTPPGEHAVQGASGRTGRRSRGGIARGQVLAVAALIGVLCWGAWVTRGILDLRAGQARVVKVQLARLVGDFVRAEARGNASSDQIGLRTAHFMKVLEATIARHARGGQILLVSEAVVGGSVPDITADIAREVQVTLPAQPPTPSPPASGDPAGRRRDGGDVEGPMRDDLLHEGATQ